MFQLKKEIMEEINELNKDWVSAINEGAASGQGIDLGDMFAKYSDHVTKLDEKFNMAAQRIKGKGKGFF
jgi:hypothetical protein